jgi:TetR/AcrR family transcriptional repressor of mexJK operon
MKKDKKTNKRGRPVDEGKRDEILDVAGKLFMDKGFHSTSMDDIAQFAGMSKLTLYRRFPDKQSLFVSVVEEKCQSAMPNDLYQGTKETNPRIIIQGFCLAFFSLIMSNDAIRLYRMMLGEAAQSPDMTKLFYNQGPKRVKKILDEIISDFKKRKILKTNDVIEARNILLSLFTGSEIYMRALLNIGKKPSRSEIEKFVKKTADFFVRNYLCEKLN